MSAKLQGAGTPRLFTTAIGGILAAGLLFTGITPALATGEEDSAIEQVEGVETTQNEPGTGEAAGGVEAVTPSAPEEDTSGDDSVATEESSGEEDDAAKGEESVEETELEEAPAPSEEATIDPQPLPNSAPTAARNREISGTITFPAGMTAEQKKLVRVSAQWQKETGPGKPGEKQCGYRSEGGDYYSEWFTGTFDSATSTWKVPGLGTCKYTVSIVLDAGPATNNWWFALWNSGAKPYDLAAKSLTGIRASATPAAGLAPDWKSGDSFEVVFAQFQKARADKIKFSAKSVATGKTIPVERVNGAQSNKSQTGIVYYGFALKASGSYKFSFTNPDTGITRWYDGTKSGTLLESKAKPVTFSLYKGKRLKGKYVFDLKTKLKPTVTSSAKYTTKGSATVSIAMKQPDKAKASQVSGTVKVQVYNSKNKVVKTTTVKVAKGKASVKLTKLPKGTYTIKTSYAGTKKYAAKSSTAKVTIKK